MRSLDELRPLLERVAMALPDQPEIYLIGGAVRDILRGRPTHDLDFALPHGAIQAGRSVANALDGDFYPLDVVRDTGRVLVKADDGARLILDFAAFRGPDLDVDLRDRDFTINAIAIDLHRLDHLIDPLSGRRDLQNKRLRACSADSFVHDPVRILRAVRLATALEFRIDPETLVWLRQATPLLKKVSAERLRDEVFKILDGENPVTALRMLDMLDLVAPVFPALGALKGLAQYPPHIYDAWEHTLNTVQRLTHILNVLRPEHDPEAAANWTMGLISLRLGRYRAQLQEHLNAPLNPERSMRALLLLAALMHDAGKPEIRRAEGDTTTRFRGHEVTGADLARQYGIAARLSNAEVERLTAIVRGHMLPVQMLKSDRALAPVEIYRFFRETGAAGVDICLLNLADTLAVYGPGMPQEVWVRNLELARALLEGYWEKKDEIVAPPALINGNELMSALSLSPGPRVGEILEAIREAQVSGEVNTAEQAIELARSFYG